VFHPRANNKNLKNDIIIFLRAVEWSKSRRRRSMMDYSKAYTKYRFNDTNAIKKCE
jgi:hypothetical protein